MELFSKRNEGRIRRYGYRQQYGVRPGARPTEDETRFLKDTLRNRLREQIKHLIRSKSFLEPFLYVDNKQTGVTYLHSPTLSDLSMRELGYDLASAFDLTKLEPMIDDVYEDAKFFDLVELLIIFSKSTKREELTSRLANVFKEEGDDYAIHGFMVVSREQEGLRSIIPLLKEKNLKERIKDFYEQRAGIHPNYETLSKVSADILQLLFSSPKSKKKTKEHSTDLCNQVAKKWTDKDKVRELAELFGETVINAKNLSNQVQNVRHTDRTTIPIEAPNFYKLIATKNINIIELVILSLPESFIASQNPEVLKEVYLKHYDLNKDSGWLVNPSEQNADNFFDEIDPSNIPF